jgi:hypothetical protein
VTSLASEQNGVNLDGTPHSLAISRNGRYLAFSNYSSVDPLGVFVRDLATSDVHDVGAGMPPVGFCPSADVTGITDDGTRLLVTEHAYQLHQAGFPCQNPYDRTVVIDLSGATVHYSQGPIDAIPKLRDLSADGQWIVTITSLSAVSRSSVATQTPSPWFYGEGKTNSLGCIPEASFAGLASLSGIDHLTMSSTLLRNQTSTLFLWGNGIQEAPFFGGILCATPPLHRTPLQSSGGSVGVHDCSGAASFDFTSGYLAQCLTREAESPASA